MAPRSRDKVRWHHTCPRLWPLPVIQVDVCPSGINWSDQTSDTCRSVYNRWEYSTVDLKYVTFQWYRKTSPLFLDWHCSLYWCDVILHVVLTGITLFVLKNMSSFILCFYWNHSFCCKCLHCYDMMLLYVQQNKTTIWKTSTNTGQNAWSQGQFPIVSSVPYRVIIQVVRATARSGFIAVDDILFQVGGCQGMTVISWR